MITWSQIARWLIAAGISLTAVGGIILLLARLGLVPGTLPGDLRFQAGRITCFIPIATSILLSLLLTLVLNLILRLFSR
ncbi:MAG: DUF2905 domain-containing protein [Anaerolineales bacterium]|nr:DUF2905 domain-containing protein [Anaerolineales bacterium]